MNESRPRWGVPRQVWQLGWISFLADVCSEIVYPIIPLFLKNTLGAPALALGAVEGIAESIVSFLKGWSGWHSDRSGKRTPYIKWGYGLSALGKGLLALAWAWPAVLGARTVDRLGKGIRTTARDAMIADVAASADYGRAFGLHRGLDTAGALLGVIFAILLLWIMPQQYRLIFLLAVIPGAASVLLALRLKEPPHTSDSPTKTENGARLRDAIRTLPAGYWRAFALSTLFAIANSSDAFLLLRASELGLSDVGVVLCYAAYNVTYALLAFPAGILSDRIGRWRIVGIGWILYALVYAGFAIAGASFVALLFAAYGAFMGLTQGAGKAIVADYAPANLRGTAMGLFYTATGFSVIAASLLTGVLWDKYSPQVALNACAAIAAFSALLIPLTSRIGRAPISQV